MAYEIRPISIGEILDMGFRLLRNHFGTLVGLMAIVNVPLGFLGYLLTMAQASSAAVPSDPMTVPLLYAAIAIVSAIGMPWIGVAITVALGDAYAGRPTGVRPALRHAWPILLPALGTSVLTTLFIGLGLLLLVVPGIWFILSYWFTSQVIAIERVFGMAALRRSSELMKGNKGRGVVLGLVVIALDAVVRFGATWALGAWPVFDAIASVATGMVTGAYFHAADVAFYFDVRCRREAFDLEYLARVVEERGVPAHAA